MGRLAAFTSMTMTFLFLSVLRAGSSPSITIVWTKIKFTLPFTSAFSGEMARFSAFIALTSSSGSLVRKLRGFSSPGIILKFDFHFFSTNTNTIQSEISWNLLHGISGIFSFLVIDKSKGVFVVVTSFNN